MCQIGVLREAPFPTHWESPTFITPKKDGRVRWVSDFRELNKALVQDVYPLPVIHDVIMKRKGFDCFYSFGFDNDVLRTRIGLGKQSVNYYCYILW